MFTPQTATRRYTQRPDGFQNLPGQHDGRWLALLAQHAGRNCEQFVLRAKESLSNALSEKESVRKLQHATVLWVLGPIFPLPASFKRDCPFQLQYRQGLDGPHHC